MDESRLTSETIDLVAARFHALAEPARLQLMTALREGERSVSELVAHTGLGTANGSKHLQLLHAAGFVKRRKDGIHVRYALADGDVFRLCDIVCGRLVEESTWRQRMLAVA